MHPNTTTLLFSLQPAEFWTTNLGSESEGAFRQVTAVNSRSSDRHRERCRYYNRTDFFQFARRVERVEAIAAVAAANKAQAGTGHRWSSLSRMLNPGICCSEGSPERVERAAESRRRMMGTGAARSGCRCPLLFLLLLVGTSCHMLHGQGKKRYSVGSNVSWGCNQEYLFIICVLVNLCLKRW